MPRSQSENDNVQFVQELAEVDGPFESPININFRDLTKLELPPLVWNRSEACPKKMKVTNTGHTIILSGKWKCERPYLTGGPLQGKYVFSQIHFHWGADDCKGSEHLICGEGFPLEMHVPHFKTEYLSQECALAEKDGMVVLVYLFKLQEEPNVNLKRILNVLPNIKQASCSQMIDPRPILSLCNPFTDDYFMYWGSIVNSTCAHILLWLICREPFGISKEQLQEFRKILDSAQQPICRNYRDTQPLHKRNVFHVNASKNLDNPLLPIKKIVGCFCCNEETGNVNSTTPNGCCCQEGKNQEDIEGTSAESSMGYLNLNNRGAPCTAEKEGLSQGLFVPQSVLVHRAAAHSAPLLPKLFDNKYFGQLWTNSASNEIQLYQEKPKVHPVSLSCCFIPPMKPRKLKVHPEKQRMRRGSFNSARALSNIINSLDALKNQTFKKLKEIDSINQEIKGMKPFCQDTEDKKWLRKIEKIVSKQKHLTLKSSTGCLSELKKLAKECSLDKFCETKAQISIEKIASRECSPADDFTKTTVPEETVEKEKIINVAKAINFSTKARKLIQSFFEDIQESDDLQRKIRKDLKLKKIKTFSYKLDQRMPAQADDQQRGFITKKMFTLGNLGNRFFTEVTTEDPRKGEVDDEEYDEEEEIEIKEIDDEMEESLKKVEKGMDEDEMSQEEDEGEENVWSRLQRPFFTSVTGNSESLKLENDAMDQKASEHYIRVCEIDQKAEEIIPLHRANVAIGFSDTQCSQKMNSPSKSANEFSFDTYRLRQPVHTTQSDTETSKLSYRTSRSSKKSKKPSRKLLNNIEDAERHLQQEKIFTEGPNSDDISGSLNNSNSAVTSDSVETQRMIIAKFHKKHSKKDIWNEISSTIMGASSKKLSDKSISKKHKIHNINVEGYYIKKRKHKKKKMSKTVNWEKGDSSVDLSSLSKIEINSIKNKFKGNRTTKTRFKLEIQNTSDSSCDSTVECSVTKRDSKKIKLEDDRVKMNEKQKSLDEEMEASAMENCRNGGSTFRIEKLTVSRKKDEFEKDSKTNSDDGNGAVQNTKTYCEWIPMIVRDPSSDAVSNKTEIELSRTPNNLNLDDREMPEPIQIGYTINDRTSKEKQFLKKVISNSRNTRNETLKCPQVEHGEETSKPKANFHEFRPEIEFLKRIDPSKSSFATALLRGVSTESHKKSCREIFSSLEFKGNQTPAVDKLNGFDMSLFTTPDKKLDKRFLALLNDTIEAFDASATRCNIEKYHFLDKELQEVPIRVSQNNLSNVELKEAKQSTPLLQPDSNKSFSNKSFATIAPDMKGDANSQNADNNELLPNVSYTAPNINSASRPHSVETLTVIRKTRRGKHKKRPHCRKRNSGHYMRKNSCVFKKLSKVDSKPHFLNLSNEEHLKVISANVAKYLKQKFKEGRPIDGIDGDLNLVEVIADIIEPSRKLEMAEEMLNEVKTEKNQVEPQHDDILRVAKVIEKIDEIGKNLREKFEENQSEPDSARSQYKNEKGKETIGKTETKKRKNKEESAKGKNADSSKEEKLESQDKNREERGNEKKEKDAVKIEEQYKDRKLISPRPHLNFIKLNKLMAGKYRRPCSRGNAKEDQDQEKKKLYKSKIPMKTVDRNQPAKVLKNDVETVSPAKDETTQNVKGKDSGKKKRMQSLDAKKTKPKQVGGHQEKPSTAPTLMEKRKEGNEVREKKTRAATKNEEESLPEMTSSSLAPTYAMTSYTTTPTEFAETPQQKVNRILMSVQQKAIETYLPDVVYETKNYYEAKTNKGDASFAKDLENLIKLQMCLNNEIATNIENSMNYIKTLLNQDYNEATILDKAPMTDNLNSFEQPANGVVLIEMNDVLPCSSSDSDRLDECERPDFFDAVGKDECSCRERTYSSASVPKESGDSEILKAVFSPDPDCGEDEYHSDSSCNCEISITLNARDNEGPLYAVESGNLEKVSNVTQILSRQDECCTSSKSVVLKPLRKKRKENEISMEMKKKLLEILEGEIRREMSLNYMESSVNSSDTLTLKWEDVHSLKRSQSTDSGSDNTEVLTQISETMRQYLYDYKKRRLVRKKDSSAEKTVSDES